MERYAKWTVSQTADEAVCREDAAAQFKCLCKAKLTGQSDRGRAAHLEDNEPQLEDDTPTGEDGTGFVC